MQTEKTSRTYRCEDEWRALVNEYEASGVSAKKFCAQHNIAMSGNAFTINDLNQPCEKGLKFIVSLSTVKRTA